MLERKQQTACRTVGDKKTTGGLVANQGKSRGRGRKIEGGDKTESAVAGWKKTPTSREKKR